MGAAKIFPGGEAYWQKQRAWIATGIDQEYEWSTWLPSHLQLAAGSSCYSLASLGVLTFDHGLYEVDWMNYYNGRLIAESRDPWRALLLGWHVWSLLRGVGFLFLSYELIALSYRLWTGTAVSGWRQQAAGFSLGGGFLLADAVVKACLTESVRRELLANLL